MSTDYNSISGGTAADGYGYGSEGYGQGLWGSLFGGDPSGTITGGVPGGGSITGSPGGGSPVSNPIIVGGSMGPGQGVPGPRHGQVGGGVPGGAGGGLKPMLSQLLGLSPQQPTQPRGRIGGQRPGQRMQPPIMRAPTPITPPIMRGQSPVSNPIQRSGPAQAPIQRSGPSPVSGSIGGARGRVPVTTPRRGPVSGGF